MCSSDLCLEYGIYIISDEIYDRFIYDEVKFHSTAALSEEIKDITLTVNGFSKTYAMPGWRVGYTAAPEYIIKAMSTVQGHCVSHPSTVSQYAAAAALKADQSFVDEMLEEYARRRKYFRDFLVSVPGLSFIEPQGAFYYFVDISEHVGLSYGGTVITDDLAYTKLLLENKYVVCVPGSFFGAKNFIRFSYAADMHDIECGLSLYSDFINELRQ